MKWSVSPFWNNNHSHDHNHNKPAGSWRNDAWSDHDFECFAKSILSRARNIFCTIMRAKLNPIRIFLWAGRNYGLLQEAGVTSRTSNFRRCSREQYLSCFQAISRRFSGGLRFVFLVGLCTKRRPWPNSLKTANIMVLRFCFWLESCLIYFQAISRPFWRGLRFWVFGLRFVPTQAAIDDFNALESSAVQWSTIHTFVQHVH